MCVIYFLRRKRRKTRANAVPIISKVAVFTRWYMGIVRCYK